MASLFSGFVAHPRQVFNVFVQRFFQSIDHLQHALFAIRAKCELDITLS